MLTLTDILWQSAS